MPRMYNPILFKLLKVEDLQNADHWQMVLTGILEEMLNIVNVKKVGVGLIAMVRRDLSCNIFSLTPSFSLSNR